VARLIKNGISITNPGS
jgi:hypothetical protein